MNALLIFFLTLSLSLNILLAWYARKLTKQFVFFSENLSSMEEELDQFSKHIVGIHELEMFYGDETLGGLIKHSKELVQRVAAFNNNFVLEEPEEEEEEEEVIDGST
jgi:hypothetical protein|tara:strand:+ start:5131 stop:5451 length:321 start_codon:yes stop_codon:yes gene_type:complete